MKKYKVFLRESKLKGDLEFYEPKPLISNPETINKNFKIIDAFHQMKNKKKEKHDKNGKKSHRTVLCCKNNINCNRNVAGNFLFK